MILNKEIWNKSDIYEFNNYMYSLKNEDRIDWTRNIVNTKHDVLAIKSDVIKDIAKNITKGNYVSFLDMCDFRYHEVTLVYVKVLAKIKDPIIFTKYLEKIFDIADSWATIDTIDFSIAIKNRDYFYNLALGYIESDKEYIKRTGVRILFKYLNDEYIEKIIDIINNIDTSYYYVSMVVAWILCEAMYTCRDYIISNINSIKVDDDTFKRFVSKCRDSYKISDEDKKFLRGAR